jgi:hypothetical protein
MEAEDFVVAPVVSTELPQVSMGGRVLTGRRADFMDKRQPQRMSMTGMDMVTVTDMVTRTSW